MNMVLTSAAPLGIKGDRRCFQTLTKILSSQTKPARNRKLPKPFPISLLGTLKGKQDSPKRVTQEQNRQASQRPGAPPGRKPGDQETGGMMGSKRKEEETNG